MSTVIGLASEDVNIAFLCADRQSTILSPDNQGVPVTKIFGRKLWISKDGSCALGHSGMRNDSLDEFVSQIVDGKIDMGKVVKKKYFKELRDFNIDRLGDRISELDKLSSFLLITRFGNCPELYSCFPLGRVEERSLTYIGSGSNRVDDYFKAVLILQDANNYIGVRPEMSKREIMLTYGLEALGYSQNKDPFSSGLDLVVATPEGITDHFEDLQDDFKLRIDSIKSRYKGDNTSNQ